MPGTSFLKNPNEGNEEGILVIIDGNVGYFGKRSEEVEFSKPCTLLTNPQIMFSFVGFKP